ncbi:MAG: DnaA regulatory inactivator Hda [Chromatiales bacterium]|nr:DnaA regulatory inactivator Hda [Chromatiales bacterium]
MNSGKAMHRQLALGFTLRDNTSFTTFAMGDNKQLVNDLKRSVAGNSEQFIYLWGGTGAGKTHLLQAACQHASEIGQSALYLPLRDAEAFGPEILQDLENLDLLCIDDIDAIAGNSTWEEALFHLYNRLRDGRTRLITTAGYSPLTLPLKLPDLRSRLSWGLSYQIAVLNDTEKRTLLINECQRRGLTLSTETADYILRHTSRDVGSLKELIEQLDKASLAAQRRLTIPFIKAVLQER